ncbi:aldo/keto reductase [Clostridium sp. BJN0001]|uniref:aldo/keto reductase n=1 Tax=Clostridium sp. BJN0001 TaxID=2930219 RepID=UPI001FD1C669|nr:aldo/keto reductase [Clostridium sp. BJN0001]
MKNIELGKTGIFVPRVAIGCMRFDEIDDTSLETFVKNSIDKGFNFFDHADIYGNGSCEERFGKLLAKDKSLRDKIILQSKCGIVPGVMYDLSKEHILKSVDEILKRLNTEYLDVLLLHRPDALMDPSEIAEAFMKLKNSGKVNHFGVSNMKPMQIELIKKYFKDDIVADQLQMSITNSNIISNGMEVNMTTESSIDRDGSVLDYCRLKDITIQVWSPFQYGFFNGTFLGNDKFLNLNKKIDEIAAKYNVSNTTIAAAWILRHPANMQLISGTTNKKRFEDVIKACDISLTRKEWYEIYLAAGKMLP